MAAAAALFEGAARVHDVIDAHDERKDVGHLFHMGALAEHIDRDHDFRPQVLDLPHGHAAEHAAVDELHPVFFHRPEHRGHGAGSEHRVDDTALAEGLELAALDIDGDAAEGNIQPVESAVFQKFGHHPPHLGPLHQSQLCQRHEIEVDDVARLEFTGDGAHFFRGHALGIAGADDAAHRRAGNKVGADALFVHRLQKADVRHAARAARPQGKAEFFTHISSPSRLYCRGRFYLPQAAVCGDLCRA